MGRCTSWMYASELQENAEVGDLIEIAAVLFRHWAVFAGKHEGHGMVIHLWQAKDDKFRVRYDTLAEVTEGRQCRVNNKYDNHGYNTPKKTMERAHAALSKNHVYDAITYNCEHFASYCRNNCATSDQNKFVNWLNPMNVIDSVGFFFTESGSGGSSASSS